jgi:predicted unusual protein kinase regulating ubiquinone biosynthesis (AarF/ABC1/UbiB family)
MSLSLQPKHLKRYAEIARILVRYGRSDLVKRAGLEDVLEERGNDDPAIPSGGPEPEQLARDLERLGPTFVKLGQLLSTRADFVPMAYIEALARLQDDVEPISYVEVEEVVEQELGVRISKAFQSFDVEPLASASLGQVHHAVLRDGRQVAVKVQRPGIRERVADDLEVLEGIATLLDAHTDAGRKYDFRGMLRSFRDSLVRELDYRQEARNLVTIATNLAELDRIVVPRPVDDYTTGRVLTMDYVRGLKITKVSKLRRIDVDGAALAEQLMQAYLKQILVDGFFHADPHPGNVFLTDDGRIALIDLGMVARVAPRMQDQLLKLVVAISQGNGDEAAEVSFVMGEPLAWFDRETARREIATLVAWNQGLTVQDIQVGRIVLEITRISGQNGLRLPSDLTMLGKALLNLDKVGRTLDPEFDPNASIRRHTAEVASRRMREGASVESFLGSFVDARDLLRHLPARVSRILDAVANNEIKVTVEAIDEDRLIAGLQKIANRITVGLILASLVVGAALLMRVETKWTILGYPGLAILLFLAAAIGAGTVAVHILASDGRHAKKPLRAPPK